MRRAGDGLSRSLQRARRRMERRLGRLGIGKGKKKVSSIEQVLGTCTLRLFLSIYYYIIYCILENSLEYIYN